MLNWTDVAELKRRAKCYEDCIRFFSAENYPEKWNITKLLDDDDARDPLAMRVLEGRDLDGQLHPGMAVGAAVRLRVLTRQACVEDAKGSKIFFRSGALRAQNDVLADHDTAPQKGDVVEVKGERYTRDPETGQPLDAPRLRAWAASGKRPCRYHRFIVDAQGCVTVPPLIALSLLSKAGKRAGVPHWARSSEGKRKITNWQFEEVTS